MASWAGCISLASMSAHGMIFGVLPMTNNDSPRYNMKRDVFVMVIKWYFGDCGPIERVRFVPIAHESSEMKPR